MGVCADPGSYRWCQALSRSRSSFATTKTTIIKQEFNTKNNNKFNESNYSNNYSNQTQTQTTISKITSKISFEEKTVTSVSSSASSSLSASSPLKEGLFEIAAAIGSKCAEIAAGKCAENKISLRYHPSISDSISQVIKSLPLILLAFLTVATANQVNIPEDAVHITAILGEGVIFNCHVEFPNDHPVPYVLQWDKKVSETGSDLPIYIWYESYPEHIEEGYKGRVSRVSPDSPFGSASLNLTNIKESDQGWYECKVVFLNRDPKQHKNGTWFHLDVHAPPRFSVTPEDIIYVNLGDSIILNCQADGTPTPEILWYKDANPVDPSPTVGIFNDGTELRISTIRHEDIGEYTCIARNGEGQVSHTARVIIAGGAVIMPPSGGSGNAQNGRKGSKTALNAVAVNHGITVPPTNQTKLEGEKVTFSCEAKAMPGNVTVRWFREGSPVREVASLETRITIRKDGSLIINPVSADDSGQYLCEVTNGIGDAQSASAYLNVEYPAKVTFTPTVQYLPFRLAGVVQCYIKSNPILQYVTWTKDKRLLEPYQMKDIVVMANGSLLFTRVNEDHQGRYTCTPYNAQGTQGSSGPMEVLVRKPPTFTVEPETLYQRKVGDSVEMHCDAVEAEGTQRPTIKWQRQDGELSETQRNRLKVSGGNITIENLRREDFGYYQCVVSNEVATLMAVTQLVIEGTQPHAPYNITGKATESSITLQWMPGYSGGSEYKQDYTIWYREAGIADWQTISVTPSGSTQVTINGLGSGTTYEFQVVGRNVLGDGMMSKIMTVRTLEDAPAAPRNVKAATQPPDHIFQLMPDEADLLAPFDIYFHTDSHGSIVYSPPKLKLKGPKPGPPRNLTVTEVSNGFLISWQAPLERAHIVKFYTIKYRTDAQWKTLNRGQIRSEETQYLVKNLVGGRTYYFRVLANSEKSYESSDEVKFPVPARVKHKAITAGVVGGILFFIVAIILSVCAVKICNKRKRRKQEKEFNMVACRITDARNIAVNNHHHLQSRSTGSLSGGQVPLKKYKQARISGLTAILLTILHWIWPPDRCTNCHSIYSSPNANDAEAQARRRSLSRIQRSVDGRFILATSTDTMKSAALTNGDEIVVAPAEDDVDSPLTRCNSEASQNSSSDDGGFLSRRNFLTSRASWRRPLVASPSQLSLQSATGSARGFLQGLGSLLRISGAVPQKNISIHNNNNNNNNNFVSGVNGIATISDELTTGARYQNIHRSLYGRNVYRNLPPLTEHQTMQSNSRPLHINTTASLGHHIQHLHTHDFITPNLYTPSKVSRIYSSSPASTSNDVHNLHHHHHLHHQHQHQHGIGVGLGDLETEASGLLSSPWALTTPPHYHHHTHYLNNFSDLSSVYPSSAERSLPTPAVSGNLSRYRYYSHELPSLRTIQEETRRMNEQQQQQQLQQQQQQQHHHQYQHHQQQQQQQQHHDLHGFVPLQIPSPPPWRSYYQHSQLLPYHSYRPRTRWYPRHYSRLFGRPQSELLSPLPHLNLTMRPFGTIGMTGLEASPESRSSSSGFGSKNTSNHPQGSHHSGSTSEWRLLPPYKPPPPPPATATASSAYFGSQHPTPTTTQPQQAQAQAPIQRSSNYSSATLPFYGSNYYSHHNTNANNNNHHNNNNATHSLNRPMTPPYTMAHWLDMMSRLNAATDSVHLPKCPVDVGSVDGHYEFDPSTPTPSASSPTGNIGLLRDDFNLHIDTTGHHHTLDGGIFHTNASAAASLSLPSFGGRKPRISRYDNIEARLQAMKEEFYAYRKRQAMTHAGVAEMESVC